MNEPVVRVLIVALAAAGALVVSWIIRIVHNKRQPRVDVSRLISQPGVVVFTKDDCPNCAAVLKMLEPTGAVVRQVRAETEPEVFEQLAIEGVPLTVIVAAAGRQVAQFAGLPRAASLRRALRRVGEIPSTGVAGL